MYVARLGAAEILGGNTQLTVAITGGEYGTKKCCERNEQIFWVCVHPLVTFWGHISRNLQMKSTKICPINLLGHECSLGVVALVSLPSVSGPNEFIFISAGKLSMLSIKIYNYAT